MMSIQRTVATFAICQTLDSLHLPLPAAIAACLDVAIMALKVSPKVDDAFMVEVFQAALKDYHTVTDKLKQEEISQLPTIPNMPALSPQQEVEMLRKMMGES